jgi:hypothetical protein
MVMAEKNSGCLGCLGSLVVLGFLGSLVFGGGLSMRVGGFSFVLGGKSPVDQTQVLNNYFTDLESSKIASEAAVKIFHTQLGKGQCKEIYDQASEIFKKDQNQAAIIEFCTTLKQSLGEVKSVQLIDWWGRPGDTESERYILLRFMTTFSKSSEVPTLETFIWLVKDGKPGLVTYELMPSSVPENSTGEVQL